MARKPRLQFEGAMYHITTRGNRRELIAKDEMDYAMLQKTMIEAMNWAGVWLFSWCLMPNHIHVLVETVDANISAFMQRWLTCYARYFNWRYKLVGHVFQGRYNAKLVQKEAYFKELIRYIHLNPFRVKNPGWIGPDGWKWSSHRFYLDETPPEGCRAAIDQALSMFGPTPEEARKHYAQFLADGLREGNWEDFYKNAKDDILGDESFVKRHSKIQMDSAPHPVRRVSAEWSLDHVLTVAQQVFQIGRNDLAGPNQKRQLSRIRQAIAKVTRSSSAITINEVAAAFGRDPSAVSQMLRRMENQQEERVEVKALLDALENTDALQLSGCHA